MIFITLNVGTGDDLAIMLVTYLIYYEKNFWTHEKVNLLADLMGVFMKAIRVAPLTNDWNPNIWLYYTQ